MKSKLWVALAFDEYAKPPASAPMCIRVSDLERYKIDSVRRTCAYVKGGKRTGERESKTIQSVRERKRKREVDAQTGLGFIYIFIAAQSLKEILPLEFCIFITHTRARSPSFVRNPLYVYLAGLFHYGNTKPPPVVHPDYLSCK